MLFVCLLGETGLRTHPKNMSRSITAGEGRLRRSLLAFLGQVQLDRLASSAVSEGSSGFSMVLDLGELLCHFPKEFGTMALSPLFIVFL